MMTADQIDTILLDVGERSDVLPLNDQEGREINSLISDFQDWYWLNLDQWPVNMLATWETRAKDMADQIGYLETKYAGKAPPVWDQATEVETLVKLDVVATWPLWMKVTAAGILAFMGYKVLKKTKVL